MKLENQTFTTDVTLDCNEFVDCVIKNCAVIFQGGSFSLIRTTLDHVRFASERGLQARQRDAQRN
jgi:hypothetical protein